MPRTEAIPDLCIIGASEAGLAACLGAVALGLSCVLVDDGDPSGLDNPDLLLATLAHAAAEPAGRVEAWRSVRKALAQAAPERRHARFAAMNVRIVRGIARFGDATTLLSGGETIRARRFFIATGGVQPGWDSVEALPPEARPSITDLARLDDAPRDMLVVGGGPRAVSAAQSLARLGTRVTLAAPTLLPGFDPELAAPLVAGLRRDGVQLRSTLLQAAHPAPGGITARFADGTGMVASHLLLAEDGRPALKALDLERAGVAREDGSLVLDAGLRTTRRHILAVGRAAGAASSAEGIAQAGHALRAAFLPVPQRFRAELVPSVTATQPQIATVGRVMEGTGALVWRWPLEQTGGGALFGTSEGQIKVTTDRRGRILHAGLVGPQVRDLVPFWTLALSRGLTLGQLAGMAVPVPSLSEAVRSIAVQDLGRRLGSPWVRRMLQAARWLG